MSLPFLVMLLAAPSEAAESVRVLASHVQATDPESRSGARTLETAIVAALRRAGAFDVARPSDAPAWPDYDAPTYLASCPLGDLEGCTLVVAQRVEARWAIAATLAVEGEMRAVDVTVVDVASSSAAVSFATRYPVGEEAGFVAGLVDVVKAAEEGVFTEEDLRPDDTSAQDAAARKAAQARALKQLASIPGLGDPAALSTRGARVLERPALSSDDLARRTLAEGASPWERLGMTSTEYLAYKNSGMSLPEWRLRTRGRAGTLLVRPWLGVLSGPWGGTYYGRYAYDEQLYVVDTLSAQVVQADTGGAAGLGVAWGVRPDLDVGVVGGVATGTYTVDIDSQVVGSPNGLGSPTSRTGSAWFLGPRVTWAPMPTRDVRPVAGAGLLVVGAQGVRGVLETPQELTTWDAPLLWDVEVFGGVEARVAERVDLYGQVPLRVRVAGRVDERERQGVQAIVDDSVPAAASVFGGGVQVGVQVRFGRMRVPTTRDYEEIEDTLPE
jgi:hypothetical protein